MPGEGRGARKGEAGGLKPVSPGSVGRTLLQGRAGNTQRDAVSSLSVVPLTAAAPHSRASVPGFPPAIGSPGGVKELLARASSAELSATLAMLKFRALQVRWWETGAGRDFKPAGWEQGWVKPDLSLVGDSPGCGSDHY